MQASQTRFSLTTLLTRVRIVHDEYCPDIGPICKTRDEPGQLHDQRLWLAEARAVVEHGLTPWLGVEAHLPVRLNIQRITFTRLDGTAFVPDYENIHHRDETRLGLGDPWLLLRSDLGSQRWPLLVRVGASLPLGKAEPDPFQLGDAGVRHQHIQFGTGTLDPIVSASLGHVVDPWSVRLFGQAVLPLYRNAYGYQAGRRLVAGLGAARKLGQRLGLSASVDLADESAEHWSGVLHHEGNLGRTDLLVGLGLSGREQGFGWQVSVKVPVYTHAIDAQISFPALIELRLEATGADVLADPSPRR